MTKVTVIGGGTGLSVLLRGIKNKFEDINAVVSVADDGGNSGKLREDLGMLPPGDIRSCLLALADEEVGMEDLFNYRFKDGVLKGQNIGNLLIAAFNEIHGDFEQAISSIGSILNVKGRVIPVTTEDVMLCGELTNGNVVVGESNIPVIAQNENAAIEKIYLHPKKVPLSKKAKEAILNADLLLIGPGSLYTSILVNFLTDGLTDAVNKSQACKIYVANVMTQPGETSGFSLTNHVEKLVDIIGGKNIDFVMANNKKIDSEEIERYSDDNAVQVLPDNEDRKYLEDLGITLVENNFIETKQGYIRHDSDRIGDIIKIILED